MHIHDTNTIFTGREIPPFIEQHGHKPPRFNRDRNYTLRTTHTSSPETIDANLFDMDMTSLILEIDASSQPLDESMLVEIDTFGNLFGSFFKHQDYRRGAAYRIPDIRIYLRVSTLPDDNTLEDNGYKQEAAAFQNRHHKRVFDTGAHMYIYSKE